MPNARIEEEGILRFGVSKFEPYSAMWGSVTLLPRFELSGRYTEINGVPGFANNYSYGFYKDKSFDAKLLLRKESKYLPAVAVGTQDYLGTRVFSANFLAFNKRLGDLDITLGYGSDRINGAFGGIRYRPTWHKPLGLVIEYDANNYQNDFNANLSGADKRKGGVTYALEYRYGWLGTQISYQGGDVGISAYVSIPLMEREFIPKLEEPKPYTKFNSRPTLQNWNNDFSYSLAMARALDRQGFKNVRFSASNKTLEARLTHTRISLMSRAVGRAARTLLLMGPLGIESIRITYTENDLPVLVYHFKDVHLLQTYFEGLISRSQLEPTITIEYPSKGYAEGLVDGAETVIDLDRDEELRPQVSAADEGHFLSFKREDRFLSGYNVAPLNLRIFFNDPSGAFHYDAFALARYKKHFGNGLFFNTDVRLTLVEDLSEVTQTSNSLLPHVRTDVIEYRKGDRLKLNSMLLNKYFHPSKRVYSRVSAGYYEEMFGGAGGQLLYLPEHGNWAFDLSVDWLWQRDPNGPLGFRDYSVVTALGALHYRLPTFGLTTTARAGRFLAKDDGVRLEIKRRFRSGVEIGAWYTVTNGNDITPPGSPGNPYYDKGVFLYFPLNTMLTKDTRARASLSLAPWTRDVGQMVVSPGDLYGMMEQSLMLGSSKPDLLTNLER